MDYADLSPARRSDGFDIHSKQDCKSGRTPNEGIITGKCPLHIKQIARCHRIRNLTHIADIGNRSTTSTQ